MIKLIKKKKKKEEKSGGALSYEIGISFHAANLLHDQKSSAIIFEYSLLSGDLNCSAVIT